MCTFCVCSCLCLMCELSRLPACISHVAKLLPSLAAAASHKHYAHHVFFLQSVCKQVLSLLSDVVRGWCNVSAVTGSTPRSR